MTHWVKIIFPCITDGANLYSAGEIVKSPSQFLINCAKSKTKMFHRDSNSMVRVCKFIKKDNIDEEEYIPDEFKEETETKSKIERVPAVPAAEDQEMIDELSSLSRAEKEKIAKTLGLKKSVVTTMKDGSLIQAIISLRKL